MTESLISVLLLERRSFWSGLEGQLLTDAQADFAGRR